MRDWYDRHFEAFWVVVAVLVAVLLVGACSVVVVAGAKEDIRLMEQCQADGRKEYECRSMLRENRPPPPVVIHSR